MTTMSTAAWVAHDLGLAAGVGGPLFGRVALHRAIRRIPDEGQRGAVVQDAWMRYNPLQLAGLGIMALSWYAGRAALSGREVDSGARPLVILKDVLVAGTVVTAIGAAVTGRRLGQQAPGGAVPMDDGGRVSGQARPEAKRLEKAVDAFGIANLVLGAGVMAVTTILAMRAGQSGRWSVFSRLLA